MSGRGERACRALRAAPAGAGRARPRRSRPVLHARGARPRAAACLQPLHGAFGGARLPLRADRPGLAGDRDTGRGGCDPRHGPSGQRLRPLGRAAVARRRRDRDRSAAVPLRAAGRAARCARIPHDAPRGGGRARPQRRGRARPDTRDRRAAVRAGRRPCLRSRADARRARAACSHGAALPRGADGVRLWRLLRLRRPAKRRLRAALPRRPRTSTWGNPWFPHTPPPSRPGIAGHCLGSRRAKPGSAGRRSCFQGRANDHGERSP